MPYLLPDLNLSKGYPFLEKACPILFFELSFNERAGFNRSKDAFLKKMGAKKTRKHVCIS